MNKKISKKPKKEILKPLFTELLSTSGSIKKKTLSVMTGIFIGLSPIWGFQTIAAIIASYLLKLNKILTIGSSTISIPPLIPFIIYGGYLFGGFVAGKSAVYPGLNRNMDFKHISSGFYQYLAGSLILAFIAAFFAGILTYLILKLLAKSRIKTLNRTII